MIQLNTSKVSINKAKQRAKEYYDRTKQTTNNFLKIGDLVIIKQKKYNK